MCRGVPWIHREHYFRYPYTSEGYTHEITWILLRVGTDMLQINAQHRSPLLSWCAPNKRGLSVMCKRIQCGATKLAISLRQRIKWPMVLGSGQVVWIDSMSDRPTSQKDSSGYTRSSQLGTRLMVKMHAITYFQCWGRPIVKAILAVKMASVADTALNHHWLTHLSNICVSYWSYTDKTRNIWQAVLTLRP